MSSKRYFIHLAYDGGGFHGWQLQDNALTVQLYLEKTLSMMLRLPVRLTGCGRTDAGVHARSYFAHFDLDMDLSEAERSKLVYKMNRYFESCVAVFEIFPVKPDVHARFAALSRTYKYYISTQKNPFLSGFSWYYNIHPDIALMNEGASLLKGTYDFTSFSKVDTDTKTNICTVSEAGWEVKEGMMIFTISADRFLRNMVRAITGTLLQLGRHKITIPAFIDIVESRDRSEAGDSVPAKGLFLEEIVYPPDIRI